MNYLYYGDNLDVLRRHVKDETVDLVYLDPPFNSNASYNVLFAEHNGTDSKAQIKAFEDTWHWDEVAAKAYADTVEGGGKVADALRAFRTFLGGSDMLAYLCMMAPRLVELRRVLKPTGSIYLHCDPTASHYLKMLMDAVFGPAGFRNEIVWKRTSAHSSAKRYGPVHDLLLFYSKTQDYVWNPRYQPYGEAYLDVFFDQQDPDGRRWKRADLTGAGVRHGETGKSWRGIDVTAKGRHWQFPPEVLDRLDGEGRVHWPAKESGMPRLKQYPEDLPGVPLQDVWTDIRPMHNLAAERLGYPTQKPEALLERIIEASSGPGDVVLDPFCGCGTAVVVAENTGRQWIGVDITSLATTVIANRLGERAVYQTIGLPTTVEDAVTLARENPNDFQWWALGLVGARPVEERRGADRGVDGRLFFHERIVEETRQVVLSVKAGQLKAPFVRELRGVVDREEAQIGVLISMDEPTRQMRREAATGGFYDSSWGGRHPRIQLLTVGELLGGKKIDMPPLKHVNVTYKRAPKAKGKKFEQIGPLPTAYAEPGE